MARDGLLLLCCAGLTALAGPAASLTPCWAEERPAGVDATLAVQTALQQGREHLLKDNPRAAVYVLESQLGRINGNRDYLAALRDAYRAYIKELKLAGDEAAAQTYFQRLLILDPGAVMDGAVVRAANATAPQPPRAPTATTSSPVPSKVRGNIEDDPFHPSNNRPTTAQAWLRQAEQEFGRRRYAEACRLFEKAHQADQGSTANSRDRWGYCKLYSVAEELNRTGGPGLAVEELDREVRSALELAPRLSDFGRQLLQEIQHRSVGPAVEVRHRERTREGWYVAETANFRVFHNQPRDLVERAAQVAERTRAEMLKKWFDEPAETWNPPCEIYLYATGEEYSRATQTPANSPGHSTIRSEGSRILVRRIDLHCDDPNMLGAVLPHEATHIVLAGKFGERPVPRWADEGIAVLTEPREKIERHLRNLPQYRQDRQLFSVQQLVHLNDYPHPRYIGPFYAQSVSVVEFLAELKGPHTFTHFLRDGLRSGYEAALQRHYGFRDFNELELRWQGYAFREGTPVAGVVERGR